MNRSRTSSSESLLTSTSFVVVPVGIVASGSEDISASYNLNELGIGECGEFALLISRSGLSGGSYVGIARRVLLDFSPIVC